MDGVDFLMNRMRRGAFAVIAIVVLFLSVRSLVWPSKPPPQSWADGNYYSACCAPVALRNGSISSEGRKTHYTVEVGNHGNFVDVPAGISVSNGHVLFGGTLAFVQFNRDSDLVPATHEAYALHLLGRDDGNEYVFKKR